MRSILFILVMTVSCGTKTDTVNIVNKAAEPALVTATSTITATETATASTTVTDTSTDLAEGPPAFLGNYCTGQAQVLKIADQYYVVHHDLITELVPDQEILVGVLSSTSFCYLHLDSSTSKILVRKGG